MNINDNKIPTERRPANKRRPYLRPMAGWWRSNPFFVRYMVRELTALFVGAYAIVLLVGLICLTLGEPAWEAWRSALESPTGFVLNLVALVALIYHAWTWFEIMPKTMPPIMVKGAAVSAAVITWSGVTASFVATIVLFVLVWVISS